eukprot:6463879-Amphidinium_carterae.4
MEMIDQGLSLGMSQRWTNAAAVNTKADSIVVASLNVLTLRDSDATRDDCDQARHVGLVESGKSSELVHACSELGISVIGLQETRIPSTSSCTLGEYRQYNSAAVKGQGGVSVWVHIKAVARVKWWYPSSHRAIFMAFDMGEEKEVIFVSIYGHTDAHTVEEMTELVVEIDTVLARCVRDGLVVVLGDFNLRIGSMSSDFPAVTGGLLRGRHSKNADLWLPFFAKWSIRSVHPRFDPAATTWKHGRGKRSMIDYIGIPPAWVRCVTRTRNLLPCQLFSGGTGDHNIIIAELSLQLGVVKKAKRSVKGVTLALATTAWQAARGEGSVIDSGSVLTVYDSLVRASRDIVQRVPHKGAGNLRACWIDSELWANMLEVREQRAQLGKRLRLFENAFVKIFFDVWVGDRPQILWCQVPVVPPRDHIVLFLRSRALNSAKKKSKRTWLRQQGALADSTRATHCAEYYKVLRRLTNRGRKFAYAAIHDEEGLASVTLEQRNAMWLGHWAKHYGADVVNWSERALEDVEFIVTEPIVDFPPVTEAEVLKALKFFKVGKAVPDDVTVEVLRAVAPDAAGPIAAAFNAMLVSGKIPWNLNGGYVASVPKTVPPSTCVTGYRGILVLPIFLKLLERCVLWRIQGQASVSDLQFGNVGTAFPSWMLDRHTEALRSEKISHAVIFVDVTAAFDAVVREWLTADIECLAHLPGLPVDVKRNLILDIRHYGGILERLGVEPYLVDIVRAFHTDTWLSVSRNGVRDDLLHSKMGERQGGVISPTLFDYALDVVLAKIKSALLDEGVIAQGEGFVNDSGIGQDGAIAFKDDCFLVISHRSPVQLVALVKKAAEVVYNTMQSFGLRVNMKPQKTVCLLRLFSDEGRRVAAGLREVAPKVTLGPTLVKLTVVFRSPCLLCQSIRTLGESLLPQAP